ncbi:YidC/Oxa1 family membrane protein insertase [Streptomyces sp. NBC_01408]|uniref:YidC/Oxa1 family membrane protein insertase n=1 Tax=Streptomyces sp. NBC_01408 TaxID=2903855 RepID=UPI002255BCCF|nr:YidC/Oxa1 family membrane protein insertase [Streptomyces sp. NBC_01408]MCX4693151.1 YidC/Oxa1 family membrane protein insertase [Streptomyces sp. NBC_01408]
MSVFTHLVVELGRLLEPVLAESATAAAIVLFTVLVRLALHPLSRAAFRGATPAAGLLPMLLQLPVFFVMYQAFSSSGELLGERLFAAPLGARWTEALGEGGLLGGQGLVFLGLFAAIAAVAAWSAVRGRRTAKAAAAAATAGAAAGTRAGTGTGTGTGSAKAKAGAQAGGKAASAARAKAGVQAGSGSGVKAGSAAKGRAGAAAELSAEQQEVMRKLGGVLPLLSFGTLITAAVVPLAAGLYLLTTTAWSVAEQAWLRYRKERTERMAQTERTEPVERA